MKKLSLLNRMTVAAMLAVPAVVSVTALADGRDEHRTIPRHSIASTASKSATMDAPMFYACIAASEYGDNGYIHEGMYTIPTDGSADFTEIKRGILADYGGVESDGKYYACHAFMSYGGSLAGCKLKVYDTSDWSLIEQDNNFPTTLAATDLALDPTSGDIYGCFFKTGNQDGGYVLATIDYDSKTRNDICDLANPMRGLAINAEGQMYGVDWYDYVCRIDKTTGTVERIGHLGISYLTEYNGSACFDYDNNTMYFANNGDYNSKIIKVNTTTGKGEAIGQYNTHDQFVGMYFPIDIGSPGAPNSAEDLQVNFAGGALSGTFSFTMPSTTRGGDALVQANYSVSLDGTEISSGNANGGENVSVALTVVTRGKHQVSVRCSNQEGDGAKKNLNFFAGNGTPSAPTGVNATYDSATNTITVSWDAVTSSSDGGYINPSEVAYSVTRNPGEISIADNVSQTSITDHITTESLTTYSYSVSASFDGNISDTAKSADVTVGELIPPYTEPFDAETASLWTIINMESGTKTWEISTYNNEASITYDSKSPKDDWLISPPLRLEAGKVYPFSAQFKSSSSWEERFEVMAGTSLNPQDMTITVIESTPIKISNYAEYTGYITPNSTGTYYIGIHAISSKDLLKLYVKDVTIGEGIGAVTPGVPTSLKLTPDIDGLNKATISFTAPSVDSEGNNLTSITSAEIYRDGNLIGSISEGILPGNNYSFVDETVETGVHTWTVGCRNDVGLGKMAEVSGFVGINIPGSPTGLNLVETSNPGEVTLSWQAPASDADGYPISESLIRYNVYRFAIRDFEPIALNLNGLSTTFNTNVAQGDQQFVSYYVEAVTNSGTSNKVESPTIPVGNPYQLPLHEKFIPEQRTYAWNSEIVNGSNCEWQRYYDEPHGMASPFYDGGFLAMSGLENDAARFVTGKVDISGENPTLTFYTYKVVGDTPNTNTLEVQVRDCEASNGDWTTIRNIEINSLGNEQRWYRVSVPLSDWNGHTIQLGLTGHVKSHTYVFVDEMEIGRLKENDMAIRRYIAPEYTYPDENFNVSVYVENAGSQVAENCILHMFDNDVEVRNVNMGTLQPGDSRVEILTLNFSGNDGTEHSLKASVTAAADDDTANNTTESKSLTVLIDTFPAVNDLNCENTEDGSVRLSWSAPDTEGVSAPRTTESFEDYAEWSNQQAGDWHFIDNDGIPLVGFKNVDMPLSGAQSWWINSSDWLGYQAHSGNKYIGAMGVSDDGYPSYCNDFAVSPRLDGNRQVISLWARALSPMYHEDFDILCSYGDDPTRTVSFTTIAEVTDVPTNWTRYFFEIPAGATYFAIRCCSYNSFMLFVDDVTFVPESAETFTASEYHIYRNDEKIGIADATNLNFIDSNVPEGMNEYFVIASYNGHESEPSNIVTNLSTTLGNMLSSNAHVYASEGDIIVEGENWMTTKVYDLQGRCIGTAQKGINASTHKFEVVAGIYLVNVDGKITKLIVK